MTTLGEYRVGITFNKAEGAAYDMVNKIKRAAADLIDLVDSLDVASPEVVRLKALAMTHIEDAAMWAVKATTKPMRDE